MHAMYIVDVPRSVGYQHDKASKRARSTSPIHGMSVPGWGESMIKLGNFATGVSHGNGSRH
jgi:hypothetical protein